MKYYEKFNPNPTERFSDRCPMHISFMNPNVMLNMHLTGKVIDLLYKTKEKDLKYIKYLYNISSMY
jgi:hypothetical protein